MSALQPPSSHALRFAYSTINWGAACDIPAALDEIRTSGWGAVELFGHSLDQLGTPATIKRHLGALTAATLFSGIELPVTEEQRKVQKNRIAFAVEIGATDYGLVGGGRLRFRPPTQAEYAELATFCEDLAQFGAQRGVTVNYHPHVACTIETSAEIDLLMSQTETLRLCLDASHIALVGEDPLIVIDQYWDRLGYIHLKDWDAANSRNSDVERSGSTFQESSATWSTNNSPGGSCWSRAKVTSPRWKARRSMRNTWVGSVMTSVDYEAGTTSRC